MKPKTPQLTYLSEGNKTFVLADVLDRPSCLPQPNFKGTGRALVRIIAKDTYNEFEGLKTAENKPNHKGRYSETKPCHKWGKEDLSMVGTTVII